LRMADGCMGGETGASSWGSRGLDVIDICLHEDADVDLWWGCVCVLATQVLDEVFKLPRGR
jgi:hypothetical protein